MSAFFWFLFFLAKYLCLFSLKSIILGIFLLISRFSVRVLIRMHTIPWYSLIFFLVYVGGLLVLFIYISSLNFNPVFYFSENRSLGNFLLKAKILVILLLTITQITWNFKEMSWNDLDKNNFSLNLFNEGETIFMINVGLLLLIVLWVITKLSFRTRGALRPIY